MSSTTRIIDEQSMDSRGRCRIHPGIELCRRENDEWRILLQDCPLCSIAAPEAAATSAITNTASSTSTTDRTKKKTRERGESSLKTDTTSPLSEEEEKSWTMSDVSSDTDEGKNFGGNSVKSKSYGGQQQQQHPPPPPRRKKEKKHRKDGKTREKRQPQSSPNNTVANLKELGKKLAAENTTATHEIPSSTNNSRKLPPPPPRRITSSGTDRDLRSLSTKELSELRRSRARNGGEMIEEASDLISRMSRVGEGNGRRRQTKNPNSSGGGHENGRDETKAILGAAAEARARVSNRRSKLIHDADTEIPYNDHVAGIEEKSRSGGIERGRSMRVGEDDNILGAAEEIRNRARRSLR